jgi:transcriptional regulator with XRE-family HTH domain
MLEKMQQIKAARALLDWKQADLAEASGVSLSTIRRYEAQYQLEQVSDSNREALQRAFEGAGIEFLPGGVRLVITRL